MLLSGEAKNIHSPQTQTEMLIDQGQSKRDKNSNSTS